MKPLTSSARPSSPLRQIWALVRRGLPFLIVAALGTAGWLTYRHYHAKDGVITYTTVAAARSTIVQSVTASGTVQPVVQTTVGSQVSGKIIELDADFNSKVTKGQVLVKLDRNVLEGQLNQAQARLASARADLSKANATAENAKITYDRNLAMLATGAVAQADVDAARAAKRTADASIVTARASIVEAQAAVDVAKTNLDYSTITSPIDGVVISRAVDLGQTVPGSSLQTFTLFVIAGDLAKMELHTSVAESDVGQLHEGMKVELSFDAFPDRAFPGVVQQVRNQAITNSNVVTYDAVVSVDNSGGALRPGMTATATFVVAEAKDVIAVPAKALKYKPKDAPVAMRGNGGAAPTAEQRARWQERRQQNGGGAGGGGQRGQRGQAVWVLRDGKPVRVKVEVGLSDGTTTEIKSGELKEGDLVITADSSAKTTARPAGAGSGSARRNGPPRLF